MTDDELAEREAWRTAPHGRSRTPTKDQVNELAGQLQDFVAAFGEDALRGVVKRVLGKPRGRPKSDRVAEENAVLLADYRRAQANDASTNPARFARDSVRPHEDPEPLEKRVRKLVREDDEDRRLWDTWMSRPLADEEADWLEDCDAISGDKN
jgi:hypothetical protein